MTNIQIFWAARECSIYGLLLLIPRAKLAYSNGILGLLPN